MLSDRMDPADESAAVADTQLLLKVLTLTNN